MKDLIGTLISGLGIVFYIIGGICLAILVIYGIYALIFKSVGFGLMCIGGSVVGGIILNIISGFMMYLGAAIQTD